MTNHGNLTISIITAVYNAAGTIRNCIESVKSQDWPVEHIIIDGGSSDGTLGILQEYRSHFAQVVSEKDRGLYDALNKGLRLACGDIVGILHADDFYPDSRVLSTIAQAFLEEDVDSCYGDLVYVDPIDTGKIVRYWQSCPYRPRLFYLGWMPPNPTFFVRRTVYDSYGTFRTDLGSAADYELMLRFLLRHGIAATYIPRVLVKMRTGGISNRSLAKRIQANRMDRRAWDVNSLRPHPWTLWLKPISKIPQYFRRGSPKQ